MTITGQTIAAIADPATRQAFLALMGRVGEAEKDIAEIQDYVWAMNILTGKLARLIPHEHAKAFAADIRAEFEAGSQTQRDSAAGQQLTALCNRLLR